MHGSFHAFGLANALADMGHQVTVLTNYPRNSTRLRKTIQVKTCWRHLIASKWWQRTVEFTGKSELQLQRLFGSWAERELAAQHWDIIYSWSSVSKELLESKRVSAKVRLLARGSTHISYQDKILREAGQRIGCFVERPEPSTIARELVEYELADAVVVLSSHCRQTFIEEGVDAGKVILMSPGVNLENYGAPEFVINERIQRITKGRPLRILTIGTFSQRKGAEDYGQAVRSAYSIEKFQFRFVGDVSRDALSIRKELDGYVKFVSRVPTERLRDHFNWADLFWFPSIEEGFPQSVLQAAASNLAVITTKAAAGEDLFLMGTAGWLVDVNQPEQTVQLLRNLEADRSSILKKLNHGPLRVRGWDVAAQSLLNSIEEMLRTRNVGKK